MSFAIAKMWFNDSLLGDMSFVSAGKRSPIGVGDDVSRVGDDANGAGDDVSRVVDDANGAGYDVSRVGDDAIGVGDEKFRKD